MKHLILLTALFLSSSAFAQQWVNPHIDTHRMDMRDLGYPDQNQIEADNSRVTALLTHSNGFVYGATSGKTQSYLFVYNHYINKVRPLGKIANATGVHHALAEGNDGEIYIGTGRNVFEEIVLTKDFPVQIEGVEKQLWADINKPYQGYEGGHLYRYEPETGDVKRYDNDGVCPVRDLGIPVKGDSIYAMTIDPKRQRIYGISYPNAHFFFYDLKTSTTTDLGEFLDHRVYNGPERTWRTVPRALYCDPATGVVYTSGDNGIIVAYYPDGSRRGAASFSTGSGMNASGASWRLSQAKGPEKKLAYTWMHLPGEWYEGQKSIDYPVVENFATDTSGTLYAGTSDGFLIKLDLKNEKTIVLGKPRVQRRTRALTMGLDGKLYMITGETDKWCILHSYDSTNGFETLGPIAVDHSPYYQLRAHSLDAMATAPDGTIFMGESDRRGHLFLYIPGPGVLKEYLNPTNPVVERMRPGTPGLIPEAL